MPWPDPRAREATETAPPPSIGRILRFGEALSRRRSIASPSVSTGPLSRASWTSDLGRRGVLSRSLLQRWQPGRMTVSRSAGGLALRLSERSQGGLVERARASLEFALSRPAMPTASWLGVAPPAPERAAPLSLPSVTPPFEGAAPGTTAGLLPRPRALPPMVPPLRPTETLDGRDTAAAPSLSGPPGTPVHRHAVDRAMDTASPSPAGAVSALPADGESADAAPPSAPLLPGLLAGTAGAVFAQRLIASHGSLALSRSPIGVRPLSTLGSWRPPMAGPGADRGPISAWPAVGSASRSETAASAHRSLDVLPSLVRPLAPPPAFVPAALTLARVPATSPGEPSATPPSPTAAGTGDAGMRLVPRLLTAPTAGGTEPGPPDAVGDRPLPALASIIRSVASAPAAVLARAAHPWRSVLPPGAAGPALIPTAAVGPSITVPLSLPGSAGGTSVTSLAARFVSPDLRLHRSASVGTVGSADAAPAAPPTPASVPAGAPLGPWGPATFPTLALRSRPFLLLQRTAADRFSPMVQARRAAALWVARQSFLFAGAPLPLAQDYPAIGSTAATPMRLVGFPASSIRPLLTLTLARSRAAPEGAVHFPAGAEGAGASSLSLYRRVSRSVPLLAESEFPVQAGPRTTGGLPGSNERALPGSAPALARGASLLSPFVPATEPPLAGSRMLKRLAGLDEMPIASRRSASLLPLTPQVPGDFPAPAGLSRDWAGSRGAADRLARLGPRVSLAADLAPAGTPPLFRARRDPAATSSAIAAAAEPADGPLPAPDGSHTFPSLVLSRPVSPLVPRIARADAVSPVSLPVDTMAHRAPQRLYPGVGGALPRVAEERGRASTTGGLMIQRVETRSAPEAARSGQAAAMPGGPERSTAGKGAAQDVERLANEVWSLLKRRLAVEAERRGRW